MRKLTITRRKTFVACAMSVKIYVSDSECSDIVIENMRCRKLGVIKNGETKSFEIPENGVTIYVIIDKLSKNFCNNSVSISAGKDDVSYSGKNKFAPFKGNPFIFD